MRYGEKLFLIGRDPSLQSSAVVARLIYVLDLLAVFIGLSLKSDAGETPAESDRGVGLGSVTGRKQAPWEEEKKKGHPSGVWC